MKTTKKYCENCKFYVTFNCERYGSGSKGLAVYEDWFSDPCLFWHDKNEDDKHYDDEYYDDESNDVYSMYYDED